MFTNAKTVIINNKEVSSIITSNGGVLYKKHTGGYLLTVTADKDIISAYDNETCNLTATLLYNGEGVADETCTFKVYHNNTLMETLTGTTNSNGKCTVSYVGKGTGDLNINCECMNLQETYSIEDLLLYRSSVTSSDSFNVSLPNHFQIDWTVTRKSSSGSYCYCILSNYQFGVLREKGSLSIRVGAGSPFADRNSTIIALNTPTLMTYEYNNGSHSLTANNTTVSGTNSQYSIGSFTNMNVTKYDCTDLKIKAL